MSAYKVSNLDFAIYNQEAEGLDGRVLVASKLIVEDAVNNNQQITGELVDETLGGAIAPLGEPVRLFDEATIDYIKNLGAETIAAYGQGCSVCCRTTNKSPVRTSVMLMNPSKNSLIALFLLFNNRK